MRDSERQIRARRRYGRGDDTSDDKHDGRGDQSRYVLRHRLMGNTPIYLMQHTIAVWVQTATKNEAKVTIVRGDMNVTWKGN